MRKEDYQTISAEVITEQEIQKSKFITYLKPVQTEDEAKEYLKDIRKLHPKAVHHCSAMVIGEIERSNDDGEPASSAGMPMLQVLRGNNLQFVVAIVVRYFGGILLGVGGLIRAYGSSVTQAIEASEILVSQQVYNYTLEFPYQFINDIEVMMSQAGEVLDRRYADVVSYDIRTIDPTSIASFSDITSGSGQCIEKPISIELIKKG